MDRVALWTFEAFAVLIGLVIGSFLNVCIVRMPEDRSIVTPRSHCPRCGTTLAAKDLVPVVSFVALGGRCRTCHTPHGRDVGPADTAERSAPERRAMWLQLRDFETPNVCTTCHAADALRRFLYFHDPERRGGDLRVATDARN